MTIMYFIVNGIIFLVCPSDSLLLFHKMQLIFILILYHATLLNSFIGFNRFLVKPSEFLICNIMSSTKIEFSSSFPIWINLISFSWLSYLANTSSTTLNKIVNNGHLCFVSVLREKTFTCQRTSRLIPHSSYCKQCCNEQWDTCVFFNFGFLRVYA